MPHVFLCLFLRLFYCSFRFIKINTKTLYIFSLRLACVIDWTLSHLCGVDALRSLQFKLINSSQATWSCESFTRNRFVEFVTIWRERAVCTSGTGVSGSSKYCTNITLATRTPFISMKTKPFRAQSVNGAFLVNFCDGLHSHLSAHWHRRRENGKLIVSNYLCSSFFAELNLLSANMMNLNVAFAMRGNLIRHFKWCTQRPVIIVWLPFENGKWNVKNEFVSVGTGFHPKRVRAGHEPMLFITLNSCSQVLVAGCSFHFNFPVRQKQQKVSLCSASHGIHSTSKVSNFLR